ncbi:MAG: hypothetical protein ACLR2G_12775 [Phascolarctobacterium faecium]
MATKQGASTLGFTDVGGLVGQADIVLYDMQKPYWYPRHDRVSLLVYAASATDADTVIVNGKGFNEKWRTVGNGCRKNLCGGQYARPSLN